MELGDPSRGDEKPPNRQPSLHYSTSNRTSTKERIGLLSLYSSFFQIKHILSTRNFISLLFPLLLLPLGIVFILVLLFFALLSGHDIFPWSKMRYEGESYKRKIINSYPQDLIPCSASTTESLIDLLPLRGSQRQQGQWGRTRAVIGFANNRAGGQTVHLRLQSLPLGSLLFAVFVERVHDVVQALVYDLTVASHHRH